MKKLNKILNKLEILSKDNSDLTIINEPHALKIIGGRPSATTNGTCYGSNSTCVNNVCAGTSNGTCANTSC